MKDDSGYLSKRRGVSAPDIHGIAIEALTFIARDPEAAERFLASSGLSATDLRAAAGDPGFLLGVMDFVMGDEALLLAFAQHAGLSPEDVVTAHDRLNRA